MTQTAARRQKSMRQLLDLLIVLKLELILLSLLLLLHHGLPHLQCRRCLNLVRDCREDLRMDLDKDLRRGVVDWVGQAEEDKGVGTMSLWSAFAGRPGAFGSPASRQDPKVRLLASAAAAAKASLVHLTGSRTRWFE